jgi:hypothetical protein
MQKFPIMQGLALNSPIKGEQPTSWSICRNYSYLVDPASSHMLVSKIKPCMSKYKLLYTVKLRWLIKSVIVYLILTYYLDNRGNSAANTCVKARLLEGPYLLDLSQL